MQEWEDSVWPSITLFRVDWSCLRMRKDGLSLSAELLEWGLWQRAKRQQGLRRGLSLLSLNLVVPTTLRSSSDTQLSSLLWSCNNPIEEAFVPAWHQLICWKLWLYSAAITNLWCLQQESLNQQRAKDTKFLCNVISGSGAPATVCLLLDSWDIEQSLLGFLRDDCCLLNNLVQA